VQAIIDTIKNWANTFFGWLQSLWDAFVAFFSWLAQAVFSGIVSALTVVLAAIPVPTWFENLDFSGVHPAVAFFGEPFRIGYGIGVVTSALVIRFLIRRIPVIG